MPLNIVTGVQSKAARDAVDLEPAHLDGFRRAQRLAYDCAEAIERELREGITERAVAKRMAEYLGDHGVREFFHRPFAWFGDRTAFTNFRTELHFFPTFRALAPNTPVILDVAPIVDGHAADIGYTCTFGELPLHAQMMADLEAHRTLILEGVRARRTFRQIYAELDRLIERQGYHNRHQRYPFRVLGHRVNFTPPSERTRVTVAGFGAPALGYLFSRFLENLRGAEHHSPFWNDRAPSDRAPDAGVWAVEPHIGLRGVGAKWEELLVITDSHAYWLDDELPHVRRWRQAASRNWTSSHEVHA